MNDTAALNKIFTDVGVDAAINHHVEGPTTTRYEVQLGPATDPAHIERLAKKIAVTLGHKHVRVAGLAPRTGMGIDVPNATRTMIPYGRFNFGTSHPLTLPLGVDSDNQNQWINLQQLPHLIVAGTTGSGKSTWLNCAVSTLIKRNDPDIVRVVLIDPKRVEMAGYADAPHLWAPTATNAQSATSVLDRVVSEMEDRYSLIEGHYRNIEAYNAAMRAAGTPEEVKPYLVVVVDELADLMMTSTSVEPLLVRLSQLGRAAAIHLLTATQRPSAKVITGLLKANIPARLAFTVANHVDSMIILDETGAQTLLGLGDGLFKSPATGLVRAQAPYMEDDEIDRIVIGARSMYPDATYVVQPAPQQGVQPPSTPSASSVPTRRPAASTAAPQPATRGAGVLAGYRDAVRMGRSTGYQSAEPEQRGITLTPRKLGLLVAGVFVAVCMVIGFAQAAPTTALPDPVTATTTVPNVP